MAALDPQVPRLTVNVGGPVDGTTVTLDGEPIEKNKFGTEMLVDPGPHIVVVRRRRRQARASTVPLEAGGSSEIRSRRRRSRRSRRARATTNGGGGGSGTATATSAAGGATTSVRRRRRVDPGQGKRVAGVALGAGASRRSPWRRSHVAREVELHGRAEGGLRDMTDMCDPTG